MIKSILFTIILLSFTSCKTSKYTYFYYELGRLDCNCATELSKGITANAHGIDASVKDSLDIAARKRYEIALNEYQLYLDKHWYQLDNIRKEFDSKGIDIDKEYLRGYEPCNCDTCLFKKKSLEDFKSVKQLKQI